MSDSTELVIFCRQHEAPGGLYATGIITRTYRQVSSGPWGAKNVHNLEYNHNMYAS
jgi:hypothetical protein